MSPSARLTVALLGTALLLAGCESPPAGPIAVREVGFAIPESVLHDPEADLYYVANINGSPLAVDDNGFISVLSPDDGTVRTLKWIDGAEESVTLHAPKGMALSGDHLYVADLNTLRWFDRRTGAPVGQLEVPGATFLNDVTAGPDGAIYFTDTGMRDGGLRFEPSGTDAVYRLVPGGALDTLAMDVALGGPNGVAVTADAVWVVAFRTGEVYRLAEGARTDVVKVPGGVLDGLVVVNGEMLVSSWEASAIFRGPIGGPFTAFLSEVPEPADIGYDARRSRLLIPLFNDGEVRLVPLAP